MALASRTLVVWLPNPFKLHLKYARFVRLKRHEPTLIILLADSKAFKALWQSFAMHNVCQPCEATSLANSIDPT